MHLLSSPRRGVAAAALLGLVAAPLAVVATSAPASAVPGASSTVFINEIHYDNASTDVGEFVEIANPAGADLTGWDVVLYNGNGGVTYGTAMTLNGTSALQVATYPTDGIQNGAPDGVALVNARDQLVQFLSYEGVITASNGPAVGQMSTNIGVSEAGNEPVGQSLQLTGSGDTYGDFTWTGPAAASPGTVNAGQTLINGGGEPQPAEPVAACGDGPLAVDTEESASRSVSATDADSRIVSAAITAGSVSGITLDSFTASAADGDPGTATLNVADTTADGTYEVELTFTNDDSPAQTVTCTVTVVVSDQDAVTKISAVQGSGATSPLAGEVVNVEAIVTSVITSSDVTDGFFLQEEDIDADTDPETSEGVYVFCRNDCPEDLAAGDQYRVTGEVGEFRTNTQIAAAFGDGIFERLATGVPLPTAAVVELPAVDSTRDPATFEDVEGMRSTIPTTMAVSEYFNQARLGEVVLTAGERPFQYTQMNEPSVEGYEDFLFELSTSRIVLDDASNDQNDATSGASDEPYYYPTPV